MVSRNSRASSFFHPFQPGYFGHVFTDIRRRIELIQDFDMPAVSSCVKMSRDGKYVITTGIYKPRVKCYDVCNLSMKFERCFDSEVIKFEILSEDYSKVIRCLISEPNWSDFKVSECLMSFR